MIHKIPSELKGKKVIINNNSHNFSGREFHIEDWWDRVSGGKSWRDCSTTPACLNYIIRIEKCTNIPLDDEVLYGKIGAFGYLVHVSELSH